MKNKEVFAHYCAVGLILIFSSLQNYKYSERQGTKL